MSVKTILSVIGVHQSDRDLHSAIGLCEETQAHLSLFVAGLAAPPPIGEYAVYVSDSWYEEREADIARLKERVARVNDLMTKSGISVAVDSGYVEVAWLDREIGERAIYADLTLVGSELASNPIIRDCVLNGALFESRKPLLLLPEGANATLSPKRVLIAWDSRVEASRAVSEAMDLLKSADEIHISIVDPDAAEDKSGAEPGADLAAYLARHGLKVIVHQLPKMGQPTADVLRRHATDVAADLIVMGAYGHSRLRERMFGGVTKVMLDKPPLPLFLAR